MPPKPKNSLVEFSQIELLEAQKLLKRLDPSRFDAIDYYGAEQENKKFGKEFDGAKIRKSRFKNCEFDKVNFVGTYGISSAFENCLLTDCYMEDVNFDFTNFSGSTLTRKDDVFRVTSSGFGYSNFTDATLRSLSINGSRFDYSTFVRTTIEDIHLKFCNFENSVVENCKFHRVDFSNASLDYSTIKDVELKQVILSPTSLLHSFGGLICAENQSKEVVVKFPSSPVDISFTEFRDNLRTMEPFFANSHDYFALSVINMHFGDHEAAYEYLGKGLMHGINRRDFRMVGYYCQLASYNHFFTKEQLKKMYERLCSQQFTIGMNSHDYQVYMHEIDRIKRFLIDKPFGQSQIKITINTLFYSNDIALTARLIDKINSTLEEHLPNSSNYISIRHNSPLAFEVFASDSLHSLVQFSTIVAVTFFGLTSAVTKVLNAVKQYTSIQSDILENKIKKIKLERERELLLKQKVEPNSASQEVAQASRSMSKSISSDVKQAISIQMLSENIKSIHCSISTDQNIPDEIREFKFDNEAHMTSDIPETGISPT